MRVYTLKPPRTVPTVKTTSWDGSTYFSGLPSASSFENIPVHGPGTYYPIEFTLPEIYKLLFCTQLAEFSLNISGGIVYDEGTYTTTYSYLGSYKLPMARNVICGDNPSPAYPVIQPTYVIQNQEHLAFFDGLYGVSGFSLSSHAYETPPPAAVVNWAGFTDEDNLESIFASSYAPINIEITSTHPDYDPVSYNTFMLGSAYLSNFSIGNDGKYYLGVEFSAGLPSGPTLSSIKIPASVPAGTFTVGGKSVNFYKPPPGISEISDSIVASASISILRYLEYNPGDGSGPIWDRSTGALLRQLYV